MGTVVDFRQYRGAALVREKGQKIREIVQGRYLVPSQVQNSGAYLVDIDAGTCSCPDFEERHLRCKHLYATLIFLRRMEMPDGALVTEEVHISCPRNHAAYNAYQCDEHRQVERLLRELCSGIVTPPREPGRPGRPKADLGDLIFGAAMKVYTTKSARRSEKTVKEAFASQGMEDHALHYNTVFRCVENPATTPILEGLIQESAKPLQAVEPEIVLLSDSTGFSTTTYDRWFTHVHGSEAEKAVEKNRQDERRKEGKRLQRWVKAHVAMGTRTGVVTAIKITKSYGDETSDSKNLPCLLEKTAEGGWKIREVCCDKGYLSHENLTKIEECGAVPFVPFKSDSRNDPVDNAWSRMWHAYMWHRDEWLRHYHARSRIEGFFSSVKSKFGGNLRSRVYEAQVNEVLLKFLCANVSALVRSIHEVGFAPEFWKREAA
jgi:transposase